MGRPRKHHRLSRCLRCGGPRLERARSEVCRVCYLETGAVVRTRMVERVDTGWVVDEFGDRSRSVSGGVVMFEYSLAPE